MPIVRGAVRTRGPRRIAAPRVRTCVHAARRSRDPAARLPAGRSTGLG